jgi:hypothetical protein
MCACLPQHPWLLIFSSRGHDRQSSDQNFSSQGHDWQSSEQNNRKLISLHNNGRDNKHDGTFTKLFMHVSSRNMFPTTRNLQICVHVYCPCHCCGDWLTFGCFVPMIANHDLVKKSFGPMIAYNYHSCAMFSWWKKKYIYSMCTT